MLVASQLPAIQVFLPPQYLVPAAESPDTLPDSWLEHNDDLFQQSTPNEVFHTTDCKGKNL